MVDTVAIKDSAKIKQEINRRGEYQKDFAERIGIDKSLFSNYMTGRKQPSAPTAKKIAKGLGLKMTDIFLI